MPATYLTPGVYIEEVDRGTKPIQGVPTSITAFVGFTKKAEDVNDDGYTTRSILSEAKLISNWSQYERHFGGFNEDAYLPYSVRGFFDNGGSLCWVISVRTFGDPHPAQALLYAPDAKDKTKQGQPTLVVHATTGGPGGNGLSVEIKEYKAPADTNQQKSQKSDVQPATPPTDQPAKEGDKTPAANPTGNAPTNKNGGNAPAFSNQEPNSKPDGSAFVLAVKQGKTVLNEYIINLDDLPTFAERGGEPKDPAKNPHTKFKHSDQVKVWSITKPKSAKLAERLPMPAEVQLAWGDTRLDRELIEDQNLQTEVATLNPDKETEVFKSQSTALFRGSEPKRKGIDALSAIDNVNLICAPDLMMAYQKGWLGDGQQGQEALRSVQQAMLDYCRRTNYRFAILDAPRKERGLNVEQIYDWRMNQAGYDSMHGALYYPWLKIIDPLTNRAKFIPPCGHMAGIYARSDDTRGVHKAPANEVVSGVIDVETNVTKAEQGILNPVGINCIRKFPGRGVRVWGARTLSSDPSWRYINVRRLFNYVEESVERNTQWIVFEPNDQELWYKVRRDITAFLRIVWRSGALFGASPDLAFYVKCDEETNPAEIRDVGQMVCEIGMAPVKPAEFVIFRFSQWTAEE